jgi:hypothetical protein
MYIGAPAPCELLPILTCLPIKQQRWRRWLVLLLLEEGLLVLLLLMAKCEASFEPAAFEAALAVAAAAAVARAGAAAGAVGAAAVVVVDFEAAALAVRVKGTTAGTTKKAGKTRWRHTR